MELQESERRLEPTLPPGEAMADDYLVLFLRCAESSGRILVAEVDRAVAGFAGCWPAWRPSPMKTRLPTPTSRTWSYRRQGIGRELLARA